MTQFGQDCWRHYDGIVKLLQNIFSTNQNQVMQRRCVRDNHGHTSSPKIPLEFIKIVIGKNTTLPEEPFSIPMVQSQQFKRATPRNQPGCVRADDQTLRHAPRSLPRIVWQKLGD